MSAVGCAQPTKCETLEEVLGRFLSEVARADTLTSVKIAAGAARNELAGLDKTEDFAA